MIATFFVVLVAPPAAAADTIWTTNAADSGVGSLRWAIEERNDTEEPDLIQGGDFNPPYLVMTPLTITEPLTIDLGGVTIDANELTSIFDIDAGVTVTIRRVILTEGLSSGAGGAIVVQAGADLTLDNVVLHSNEATSGGAIAVGAGAHLTVTDSDLDDGLSSVLHHNVATAGDGGAITVADGGTLTISHTSLYDNDAVGADAAGDGGAIAFAGAGALTIDASDVSENTATDGEGGAIAMVGSGARTITNTAFTYNQAWLHAVPSPPPTPR